MTMLSLTIAAPHPSGLRIQGSNDEAQCPEVVPIIEAPWFRIQGSGCRLQGVGCSDSLLRGDISQAASVSFN